MSTIPQVARAVQHLLTTVATAAGRASGFVQRASPLTGATFTQTLVFGFLAQPHASLDELAQTAATVGAPVSAQALDQRFTPQAAACLQQVLAAAVSQALAADPVAVPLLQRFTRVDLLDTSCIQLPAALAAQWPGSGNQHTAGTRATLKLAVRLDLTCGVLAGPDLHPGRTADRACPLHHDPGTRGGLRLADLGFFDMDQFAAIGTAGGYWLSRLRTGTVVYDQTGARLDLIQALARPTLPQVDWDVQIGSRQRLACRLLATRVPQEVCDQRRRRLRAEAKRRGRAVNALALALAGWTIYVTNVPPTLLTLAEAVVLGRARWQIEWLFKLWKSHGGVDTWRSQKPARILCEVYAKLLGLVVQHWLVLVGGWQVANRSLVKAAQVIRKQALHVASTLGTHRRLVAAVGAVGQSLRAGCRLSTRKQHPTTYQLLAAVAHA